MELVVEGVAEGWWITWLRGSGDDDDAAATPEAAAEA